MKSRFSLIIRQQLFSILFMSAALLLGLIMFWYIGDLKSKAPESSQMQQLIIASTDIGAGYMITEDMVQVQGIPQAVFSERAVKDKDDILGQEASQNINKGEIIYSEYISGYDERSYSGLSSYIPAGMRAVTVPVTFYGGDSFLEAGEYVDIISTYYSREINDMASQIILERKEIIYIGSRTGDKQQAGLLIEDGIIDEFGQQNMVTVTFYLSPSEAEHIFLAAQRGIINISICPYLTQQKGL